MYVRCPPPASSPARRGSRTPDSGNRKEITMNTTPKPCRRLLSIALSAALAVTMMPAMFAGAAPAFAADNAKTGQSALKELASNMTSGNATFNFASAGDEMLAAQEATSFPQAFDLRAADLGDGVKNYVTPVKLQNPFGTCWGFAAIAAAETSILSSGLAKESDLDETGNLNLSEKHLAYFTGKPIDDKASPQYGEGLHTPAGTTTQQKFNMGGIFFYATSLFSSGIGPNLENRAHPDSDGTGSMESILGYHGKKYEVERAKMKVIENGQSVMKWVPINYNENDDWDIDSEYRYLQSYTLKESNCLPSPAEITTDKKGRNHYKYNAAATDVFKKELMAGRAISIGFTADSSQPNETGDARYISKDWAHYTYETANPNHGVTIVGWDDNYSASHFVEGHQPPGDGAWLVKNSWGSGEESFPNDGGHSWGIVKTDASGNPVLDENGDPIHTGYFWLSYYDQSLSVPETFEFDRSNVNSTYYLDQHDLMPVSEVYGSDVKGEIRMANVFTAEENQDLDQISCQTVKPNTQVTYRVYLLPENYLAPDDGYLAATIPNVSYEYGGFHKETLAKPLRIMKGQRYAIEVTQKVGSKYSFNVQAMPNKKSAPRRWGEGVINPGESYFYAGGIYYDLSGRKIQKQLLAEDYGSAALDNFPIKGFSKPVEEDLRFNILGITSLSLDKDNMQDYILLRLGGTSDLDTYAPIEWASSDPSVASLVVDAENDARADVTAAKAGVTYITARMEGIGTAVNKVPVGPAQSASVKSLKVGKKNSRKLTVTLNPGKKGSVDGYEILYGLSTADVRTYSIMNTTKTKVVLKKLKKGKTYNVIVRSYKDVGYDRVFTRWSKPVKSKKIK